jgi:hypothetical protein
LVIELTAHSGIFTVPISPMHLIYEAPHPFSGVDIVVYAEDVLPIVIDISKPGIETQNCKRPDTRNTIRILTNGSTRRSFNPKTSNSGYQRLFGW